MPVSTAQRERGPGQYVCMHIDRPLSETDLGAANISSNTFLYKSPNFKAMPRKKVKAHKNIV